MEAAFSRNVGLILSPGWVLADQFSEHSDAIITVTAGAGVNGAVPIIALQKTVPPGARAYVKRLGFRVVDMAGYDQIHFSLRRNGAVQVPWDKISGEQVVDEQSIDIDQEFGPGLLEVVAANISGTGISGAAAAAGDIRVIARMSGFLLTR